MQSPGKYLWLVLLMLSWAPTAWASEASTHFSIFVPPNNDNVGRFSALTITAHSDVTNVTIVDTDEDGDSDDSTTATLSRGQSVVVQIRNGDVNDDAGGTWDGDRFIIDSDKPVTAMLSTSSDWQHDWVPAEGRSMLGREFFVWTPRPGWEIDVVAYEDDTRVEITRISPSRTRDGGVTSVELPGRLILRQTLNRGEDLFTSRDLAGTNITETGHSYRVSSDKPVTVMFGAFFRNERDGGGYVPSEDGTTTGTHFYFPIPSGHWQKHERELRIASGSLAAQVTLNGYDRNSGTWQLIDSAGLPPYSHLDYTGKSHSALKRYDFFEVISTERINVFEGNWLETGRSGTSDYMTYVSALDSLSASDVGKEFIAYVGPPGNQHRVAGLGDRFSHLYIGSFKEGTSVTVKDSDTGGRLFSEEFTFTKADEIHDTKISLSQFDAMNNAEANQRPYLRVSADGPVSVQTANWNDNWLAFASGLRPTELSVDVVGPDIIQCDRPVALGINVTNVGEVSIENVEVQANTSGSFQLAAPPAAIGTLAAGATSSQQVSGSVACSAVSSGELHGVSFTTAGQEASQGANVADKISFRAEAVVPGLLNIVNLVGVPDACAVELSWITENDSGGAVYVVQRRVFEGSDPYVEIGRVSSLAPAMSGFVYGYRDATAAQGVNYQYNVVAVDAVSQAPLSVGGPAVIAAGPPFVEAPGRTGILATDYADAGVILGDVPNDISSTLGVPSGYDIDAVGYAYDPFNDSLYLAVSAVGIFGDGDNDGNPDTNVLGAESGLVDQPNFSVDESFSFVLDLNQDGIGDVLVGLPFGTDITYLQAAPADPALVGTSPTLAFLPPSAEQAGSAFVEILNSPSIQGPDLELVVHNISAFNGSNPLENVGVGFYVAAPSITNDVDWAPARVLTSVGQDSAVVAGCGQKAAQIHAGMFAAFGNVFSGSPRFDFVPFGWAHSATGELLEPAPVPVPGQVITSPTVFSGDKHIDLNATTHPSGMALSNQSVHLRDDGNISDGDYLHVTLMDWQFPAAEGNERYENIDLQTFRVFVLDCSATVTITQYGTSGVMYNNRSIRLADNSVADLVDVNPALTLAHSGFGTFETGGAMQRLNFGTPEDWVSDFGPLVAPEFTQYAFLSEHTYPGSVEETLVYPLGQQGIQLNAGIWFLNHYLWTYANEGSTRIETRFVPGPDCGGSL